MFLFFFCYISIIKPTVSLLKHVTVSFLSLGLNILGKKKILFSFYVSNPFNNGQYDKAALQKFGYEFYIYEFFPNEQARGDRGEEKLPETSG